MAAVTPRTTPWNKKDIGDITQRAVLCPMPLNKNIRGVIRLDVASTDSKGQPLKVPLHGKPSCDSTKPTKCMPDAWEPSVCFP